MLNRTFAIAVVITGLCAFGSGGTANASPTLTLSVTTGQGPVPAGGLVQVTVSMSSLGGQASAGFQAFVHFDPTHLQFINASYTSVPFGLAVIAPISATPSGDIDLAAGINQFGGQIASSADAPLAYLTFVSINGSCDETSVQFRSHQPPTRLTASAGGNILPLTLIGPIPLPITCPADVDHDNTVGINDLVLVITHWGACPPTPPCCVGDIEPPTGNHAVDINDLVILITSWGVCPP